MAAEIFNYCERGRDAAFWAEPINAWSNSAFIIAALVALVVQVRLPSHRRTVDGYLLILLLIAIGIGSFMFHTYATRWSAVGDIAPIAAFIFIYVMIVLTRFVGMAPGFSLIVVAGLMAAMDQARGIKCSSDLAMRLDGGSGTCLNGTIAYLPALGALLLAGIYLRVRGHPAALALLTAAVIFAGSAALRTLDPSLCSATNFAGMRIGTHFLWHILNGLTLGILVVTAIRHWGHTASLGNVAAPVDR